MTCKPRQLLVVLCSTMFLIACAADEPDKPESLNLGAELQPSAADSGTLVFRDSKTDLKRYSRFIIDPVAVYDGEDASFGGVSPEEISTLAQFMRSEFARVLGERYQIVTTPGPDVARIKLTLAGLDANTPFLSTASRVLPIGLAANLASSAAGAPGSFTGSVTFAGQFFDSTDDRMIAAFLTRRAPDAMDIKATLSTRDAAEAAISDSAERLRQAIDKIHGVQ